jgi:hypothetical protein
MLEINPNFWTENGRSLCKPDLVCLRQDYYRYKTLLMQLVGKIEYDNDGIRLADRDLASAKFNLFINKAIDENVDLAITPEYSCPWTSIEQFVFQNKLPSDNKIWVIGCQSIKPKELTELTERNNNVVWIYDEALVTQSINENKFFDPVCLFFKTKNVNNEIKDVVIVQFKTHGFGGNGFEWERDYGIPGKILYVIENNRPSTRLATIICSDTLQGLNFNTIENEYFKNSPLLLIHVQLNAKPFQSNYKDYRNSLFSKGTKEDWNKEIICLNWSRKVTFDEAGETKLFNEYGGSALYSKTDKILRTDERINNNHSKGLYYTGWVDKKSHIYFLNYDEFVFLIETTKPSQIDSDPSQLARSGPEVIKTFLWTSDWEETATIGDGFSEVCSEIEDAHGNLSCLIGNNNFIEVERIIQLSSGDIDTTTNEKWSQIINLLSFQVSDTEVNNRNTFTQDPNISSQEKRKEKLNRFHSLKNKILRNPQQVPDVFLNAILKFEKGNDSKNAYLLNLHSPDNKRKGTAIYLGIASHAQAKAFKVKIESLFNEDQQGKQVIVWYNNPDVERIFEEDNKPGINENVSKSPVSYKKTK